MAGVAVSPTTVVEAQLADIGKRLNQPSISKDDLFKVLKQASTLFSEIEQSPRKNIVSAMKPSMDALVQHGLLKHKDKDIRVLVATCISEIMRIVAPDAPYTDEVLKEIFELIVATFKGLNDTSSPFFARRVTILEMVAKVRSCVVMLDLDCDDLILEMFQTFFSTASEEPQNVMTAMRTIMCLVLEESEEIPMPLLELLLRNLLRNREGVSPAANQLARAVVERAATQLQPYITRLRCGREEYEDIIYELYRCAPTIILPLFPKLTDELLTDKLEVRLRAVKLLGRLFATPRWNSHGCRELFVEFLKSLTALLKRLTDKAVEVRLAVVDCAKQCMLANQDGSEAGEILDALSDRLQDYDDEVRTHVVVAICDFAKATMHPELLPMEVLKRVAERLRDKEISVRRETLQKLTEVYRTLCLKKFHGIVISEESFSWIPSKLIRCCFDKDCKEFRPQAIELVFSEDLLPSELPVEERVKYWVSFFAAFDKNDVKALERVLLQKQRLQHEMQNYLTLRQRLKEEDSQENQKKLQICCKGMLSSFVDPVKAEEQFQKFSQLKDNSLLKDLTVLLDPNTTLSESVAIRDDMLKRLGEKHPQNEFIRILATKCSYILFGKEHLKALLAQIEQTRGSEKEKMLEASMGLLVEFTSHFPTLLEGAEDDLMQLLKDENEHIKEGVVQILAKAGGTIRGQFSEGSGSVDLVLEKLCIEGSRKQAKYAVQALAVITSDSGLKALSALYRKLVDLLETGAHLPTVLQSLGCIAQHAMSVFETREEDLVNFLVRDLFRRDSAETAGLKSDLHDASEVTRLKIFGLKTLVKSFLPSKDAHQMQRIKGVFGILAKFLECGEVSDEIKSSEVDKAQLRLAAAKGILRLSRRWDSQISPQLFLSTVSVAKDSSAHVRRQFLGKVHQFLKERAIPHKYACAFALSAFDKTEDLFAEVRQYVLDFVETSRRDARLRQASVSGQSDAPLITYYPEYVLFYLVHVLAQSAGFVHISDGGPTLEALDPFFKVLGFFIWALLNQDGEGRYDVSKKEELDNVSVILAIFRAMKHAVDAVDDSKTENTYILCDLGIMITKDLAGGELSKVNDVGSIILPQSIYKAVEGTEEVMQKEDGSHLPATLGEGDAFSQMKASWPFQLIPATSPGIKQGRTDNGSSEGEEIEVLRKRVKGTGMDASASPKPLLARSPGAKKGRTDNFSSEEEENKVSRKRIKVTGTMEGVAEKHSKVHEKKEPRGRKKIQREKSKPTEPVTKLEETGELDTPSSSKRKRGRSSKENGEIAPPDVKRGRSEDTLSTILSEKRKRGRPKGANRKDELLQEELGSDVPSVDVESKPAITTAETGGKPEPVTPGSGKRPVRISIKKLKPESAQESPMGSPHFGQQEGVIPESADGSKREGRRARKAVDVKRSDGGDKAEASAITSPRDTPRRSAKKVNISGLESPDSKDDVENEKLVGCRIKVWWPIDKKFYVGVIESFDASKKKHKVVYDDGDVEVLNLGKQRWEHVDSSNEPGDDDQPGSPSTPAPMQQSPQAKKKTVSSAKAQVKRNVKGESPQKSVASSPKSRKEAKSEGVDHGKTSEEGASDVLDHNEDPELHGKSIHKDADGDQTPNTASKGTPKSVRRSEKKASAPPSGKGSKSTPMKQDDGAEASPSPTASKDSDDVPLDAWKSSRRKVH